MSRGAPAKERGGAASIRPVYRDQAPLDVDARHADRAEVRQHGDLGPSSRRNQADVVALEAQRRVQSGHADRVDRAQAAADQARESVAQTAALDQFVGHDVVSAGDQRCREAW